ncbi:hypothetical protein R3P38DRAFT_3283064 [Favolaschia claudopus]|uniref:Uncharacterized protein n=1 Tax=Favolaschia claudopus TaxID=2862362 RepID=A0AAW0AAR6_9AGAR
MARTEIQHRSHCSLQASYAQLPRENSFPEHCPLMRVEDLEVFYDELLTRKDDELLDADPQSNSRLVKNNYIVKGEDSEEGKENYGNVTLNRVGDLLMQRYSQVEFSNEQDLIELLSKGSLDQAVREAARQQVLRCKEDFDRRLSQIRTPILGETPEEANRPAYQSYELSNKQHTIRFFPGGGRPGTLFFDFVCTNTGVRTTTGYDVYQLFSAEKRQLLDPFYGTSRHHSDSESLVDDTHSFVDAHPRYVLSEGVRILVDIPGHTNTGRNIFTSPVIPLSHRDPNGFQW